MRLILILILAGLAVIAALAPAPAAPEPGAEAGLIVVVDSSGAVRASGRVPRDFAIRRLGKSIPGIDLSGGVTSAGDGDPEAWMRALDALTIVIPRLHKGEARIAGPRVEISGILRPGFSAGATRGAIRLALGSAWEVAIEIDEAPPPAAITLRKSAYGLEISGILPAGLDPPEALSLLGHAADGGITGGGAGDAAAWGTALARLGELAALYVDATGGVTQGAVEIDGTLLPGYQAAGLGEWLGAQLGEDWQVSLAGRELPARDGDTRHDLASGGTERLRRGRWLPDLDFEPGPETCAGQTRAALTGGQVSFVIGKSQVESSATALLDRLAGIALRCLNHGGLRLEIGGHTDDIGDDTDNRALSQKRAMAVLLELIDRGIRADAMTAAGYGETRPVAANATEEGRAMNRRITFEWSE